MPQSRENKIKRAIRRNRIAQDLGTRKYRQRVVNRKKNTHPDVNEWLYVEDPETVPEGDPWLVGWVLEEEEGEDEDD